MRARASASIQQGRLHLAAIYYAQSGLSFDEVALSLLHCLDFAAPATLPSAAVATDGGGPACAPPANALLESNASYFNPPSEAEVIQLHQPQLYSRVSYSTNSFVDAAISTGAALTPLKVFLLQVLRSLSSSAKMQRTMLCTWLSDLYMHQISLAKLLNPQSAASPGGNSSSASNGADFEPMVKSDDALDEAELTTQFKNFLRSNKYVFFFVRLFLCVYLLLT